jgi:hypothetical protein
VLTELAGPLAVGLSVARGGQAPDSGAPWQIHLGTAGRGLIHTFVPGVPVRPSKMADVPTADGSFSGVGGGTPHLSGGAVVGRASKAVTGRAGSTVVGRSGSTVVGR